MDSTTVAIVGSAFIAVLTYWLNGYSNRSLERRRVNYALKLRSFESVTSQLLKCERITDGQAEIITDMFERNMIPNAGDITYTLNNTFQSDLPEPMKSQQTELNAIRQRLNKLEAEEQQALVSDLAPVVSDLLLCMQRIRNYYMTILDEDSKRAALVADTDEVRTALPEYRIACAEALNVLAEALRILRPGANLESRLPQKLETFRDRQANRADLLIAAMNLELRTTMLSRLGQWWPRVKYHRLRNAVLVRERAREQAKSSTSNNHEGH